MLLLVSAVLTHLDTPVAEIEDYIGEDHDKIQDIENDHRIGIIERLMEDAGYIADLDHAEKEQTLAPVAAGAVRFPHRKRPGGTKAEQHDNLEDTHSFLLNLYIEC